MSKASISSGPNGDADGILQEACDWTYRRLRHWRMLSAPLQSTMTIGQDTLPFPPGFLEPDQIWLLNGSPFFLTQKDPQQITMQWQFDGTTGTRINQQPLIYSFDGTAITLDSPPDQAYTYWIRYYQQLPALSADNPTNFLTDSYQRLLRCACMAGACEWAKDNGQGQFDRTYWDQLAMDEIYTAQAESDRARRATVNAAVMIGGTGDGYPMWGFS
jgi:hypothetical protein